jgi:uncharacterized protein DUF6602
MPRGTRTPSDVFRSVMDKAKQRLLLYSDDAADFEHTGIRGDERASAFAEFFRERVPEERVPDKFGVEKGEAIDYHDSRTGQLDFVIFDRSRCGPIRLGHENLLLPCEALYAVIEVKSKITRDELNKCLKAAAKVRKLRPFKERFIAARQPGADANDDRARCLYVIFGYTSNLGSDSDWPQKEYGRLMSAANLASVAVNCIDRLFVLDRGIVNPQKPAGKWETGPGSRPDASPLIGRYTVRGAIPVGKPLREIRLEVKWAGQSRPYFSGNQLGSASPRDFC